MRLMHFQVQAVFSTIHRDSGHRGLGDSINLHITENRKLTDTNLVTGQCFYILFSLHLSFSILSPVLLCVWERLHACLYPSLPPTSSLLSLINTITHFCPLDSQVIDRDRERNDSLTPLTPTVIIWPLFHFYLSKHITSCISLFVCQSSDLIAPKTPHTRYTFMAKVVN